MRMPPCVCPHGGRYQPTRVISIQSCTEGDTGDRSTSSSHPRQACMMSHCTHCAASVHLRDLRTCCIGCLLASLHLRDLSRAQQAALGAYRAPLRAPLRASDPHPPMLPASTLQPPHRELVPMRGGGADAVLHDHGSDACHMGPEQ